MAEFRYEALNTYGWGVQDALYAASEEEALQKIKALGYFVTKLDRVSGTSSTYEPPVPRLHDAVTELARIHGWRLQAVVECALYCVPLGDRVTAECLREVLESLNADHSQLPSILKRLVRTGGVCRAGSPPRYYMERARRVQFESAISGNVSAADQPVATLPSPPARSRVVNRWVRVGVRALVVAVLTGIGSQIGGWAGGLVTAILASITAALFGGFNDHGHGA